jgi:hypothetical protein
MLEQMATITPVAISAVNEILEAVVFREGLEYSATELVENKIRIMMSEFIDVWASDFYLKIIVDGNNEFKFERPVHSDAVLGILKCQEILNRLNGPDHGTYIVV